MARIRVGISGWRYAGWRGDFYPKGLPQRLELAYAAERMPTIEVNGSFYSLQRPRSYVGWRQETPDDFVFAVKGGRFITHMKKLADVETPLANFFASGVLGLGRKLGPLLWQLPANLGFDAHRLQAFFDLLPRTTTEAAVLARRHDEKVPEGRALTSCDVEAPLRHALEVRHTSFCADVARELLQHNDIAFVVADSAGKWPLVEALTSGFMYVRLHGDTELYASGYSDEALDAWATKCLGWTEQGQDVFVYFDNDAKGFAPHDAVGLLQRVGREAAQRDSSDGRPNAANSVVSK